MASDTSTGCGRIEEALLDEAAGLLDEAARLEVEAHVDVCLACREARHELRSIAARLSTAKLPPLEIEERLVARVNADLAAASRLSWLWSALVGLTAAAGAIALSAMRGLGTPHVATWIACGLIWSLAFGVATHVVVAAVRTRRSAFGGLVGLSLAVGVVLVCPLPGERELCAACEVLPGFLGTQGPVLLFGLAGLAFGGTLTWALLRSATSAASGGARRALVAIAAVAAVGPALYLACEPFSAGSVLGLAAGLVGGAGATVVGALRRGTAATSRSSGV